MAPAGDDALVSDSDVGLVDEIYEHDPLLTSEEEDEYYGYEETDYDYEARAVPCCAWPPPGRCTAGGPGRRSPRATQRTARSPVRLIGDKHARFRFGALWSPRPLLWSWGQPPDLLTARPIWALAGGSILPSSGTSGN